MKKQQHRLVTDQSSQEPAFWFEKVQGMSSSKALKSALGILRTRFQIWRLSIWGFAPAIVYVLNTLKRRKVHRIGRVKSPTIVTRFALDGVSFPIIFFKSSCLIVALKVLSSELWNINNHLLEHPSQSNKGIFKERRKKKFWPPFSGLNNTKAQPPFRKGTSCAAQP
mgnify:CR=1 FL=1